MRNQRLTLAAAALALLAACEPGSGLTTPNEAGTDVISFEDETFKSTGSQPARYNIDTLSP